ncbi:putative gustatory receptor 98a [Drosophila novamexicana]|uniref:putative gustatory receptor 98a n=1 Tax=Drosophila novamexicana TaxID=47314 RepID=UPI0011E5FA8F|nr:putative gustatory receptor 98a [Drosophila novamexicana]
MQNVLSETIGRKVNLHRVRFNSNLILSFLFLRVSVIFGMTIYNNLASSTSVLLIGNFYSEVVLILRCSEFTLHSAFVLAIYQELIDAATSVISELESIHFKIWSQRRVPLKRIATLQQLHLLLWKTQRDIERNFERSLVMVLLKYFIDISVLPYWAYLNRIYVDNFPMQMWCTTEESGKLLEICIPCWICTRCDHLQRKFRSLFHGISVDRRNEQLNTALLRISAQLGQETCQLRVGGLVKINNEMLGKFLFGVVSYIFICVQFRITYNLKVLEGESEVTVALSLLNQNQTI